MRQQVQEVLEDIRPLVESVGAVAELLDVSDGKVLIRLTTKARAARHDPQRVQEFVAREIEAEVEGVLEVRFERVVETPAAPAGLVIDVATPPEDADTCVLTLDRVVAPTGSVLYEKADEARDTPAVRALFSVSGVETVLAKDRMLVVARVGPAHPWPELIASMKSALQAHYGVPLLERAKPTGPVDEAAIRARVIEVIDRDINPAVSSHGGFLELVDVKGPEIWLHMGGGCQGCSMSAVTLRQGVEKALREAVPEITEIHDATDHHAGETPYFR